MAYQDNDTYLLPPPIALPIPTTAQPWWQRSSFPYSQYKDLMPEDQFEKLLAMHENSAANAAMYVAVVLAVYIVLLSLLLCRYVRRRPPPRELPPPFSSLQIVNAPENLRSSRSGPSLWNRMMGFVAKPYDALRHCTLRTGAGVASISSEDNDEERCSNVLQSPDGSHHHNRRDSSIRMNQIQLVPHSANSNLDRKGSSLTVNISMDQEDAGGTGPNNKGGSGTNSTFQMDGGGEIK